MKFPTSGNREPFTRHQGRFPIEPGSRSTAPEMIQAIPNRPIGLLAEREFEIMAVVLAALRDQGAPPPCNREIGIRSVNLLLGREVLW
jgi:hypothetical protein